MEGGGAKLKLRVPTGTTGGVLLPESSKVNVIREGDADERTLEGPRMELRQGTYELNLSV